MEINIAAFLSFALVTTFTPGPNNISSASIGVLVGYKKSLRYIAGIVTGFFLVMLLCGAVAGAVLRLLPSFEVILRFAGAAYILWLAYHTLRASYSFEENQQPPMGFINGLLLQTVNPKGLIYGLAIYSTFLAPINGRPGYLLLSALLLAAFAFCATSAWALFGAAIRRHLHQPRFRLLVNAGLALLLVYTAIELLDLKLLA